MSLVTCSSTVARSNSASRLVRKLRLGAGEWKRASSSSREGSSIFSLLETLLKKLLRKESAIPQFFK